MTKQIDLVNDTLRAIIVMTDSSVTTTGQQDVSTISALTLINEMDGANYVRKLLSGKTVTQDNTNHRSIFTSSNIIWTALGAGSLAMKGVIIYQDPNLTNSDSSNIPIFWLDGGFPYSANGTTFTLPPNATTGWTYL